MLSNLVVNCCNLLILTAFRPSCIVWRIFQAVWAISTLKILLNYSIETALKITFIALLLKATASFWEVLPLTHRSSGLLPSVFNGVPNSLMNRFHECFHLYFPISIIIPIKVRRNNQRVSVFHDNRGQGSAQRSKDLQQESYLLWYHLYVFRPLKTQLD